VRSSVLPWQWAVYADESRITVNAKVLSFIVVNVLMTTSDDNYVTEMRRFMIQKNSISWLQRSTSCIVASRSEIRLQLLFESAQTH